MNTPLLVNMILSRLWRYKAKTIFMGLGVTIAVLATALLQTILGSVNDAFNAFIDRAYPEDGIVVMAGSGFMGGGVGPAKLRLADVETVVSTLGIKEWDPIVYVGLRDVKRAGDSVYVSVAGYSEKAERVRRRSVQEGDFFTAEDVRNRANVALIGSVTAKTLFPGESPIGAQLYIDNAPFTVKGVLETIGADPHGIDQDQAIWVPYTTILDKMVKRDSLSGTTLIIEDMSHAEDIRKEITDILRERHEIVAGQPDDFSVITPVFMRDLRARAARTWNVFVPLIAATAFLISTIVILSIMQISIKARIPEIGLRKAVGARSRDVQVQIVLEVLLVSAVASLIGLLLAQAGCIAVTPMLAAKFGVKRVSLRLLVVLAAVVAAMATGLLGGLWPARRAAKLNPVQALR